jgi:hypothetical protein
MCNYGHIIYPKLNFFITVDRTEDQRSQICNSCASSICKTNEIREGLQPFHHGRPVIVSINNDAAVFVIHLIQHLEIQEGLFGKKGGE